MKLSKTAKMAALILGISFSIFAISFAVSADWSQPPGIPPTCPSGEPGCDAPVHVGIGTQAKTGPLGVGGVFRSNSATYLAVDTGNVGIGTTSPGAKLDIRGQVIGGFGAQTTAGILDWNDISNARSGSGYTLLLGSHDNGPGGSYYHPFSFEYSSKSGTGNMTQFAIPYHSTGQNTGIYFRTRYSDAWQNWSRIISENTSGNVGIGTTNPQAKLDVRNNARFYDSVGNLVLIID